MHIGNSKWQQEVTVLKLHIESADLLKPDSQSEMFDKKEKDGLSLQTVVNYSL